MTIIENNENKYSNVSPVCPVAVMIIRTSSCLESWQIRTTQNSVAQCSYEQQADNGSIGQPQPCRGTGSRTVMLKILGKIPGLVPGKILGRVNPVKFKPVASRKFMLLCKQSIGC